MSNFNKFENIRPFYDSEVNAALVSILEEPLLKAIMEFAFPEMPNQDWKNQLKNIHTTQDFQAQIVSKILYRLLSLTAEHVTAEGFDTLEKQTAYLFLSNHRDIVLDTSLINLKLFEQDMILTASAIGDNLVRMPFLNKLAKINRNFLVLRGLTPREMLQSSKLLSEYIFTLVTESKRSVWMAQREGRTKDGNDATNPGILKMLAMAAGKENLVTYFKKLNIVPISISYEYDPTDVLKIPELLANRNNEKYVKAEEEDFNSISKGIMGQKKRIHLKMGTPLNATLETLHEMDNANQQIKAIAQMIDNQVIENYKLWSTNYIAADLLCQTTDYIAHYTADEKAFFVERMNKRINMNNPQEIDVFLSMYANPVFRKATILSEQKNWGSQLCQKI
jgi:1-acyl-sn-glycerol-3-phosphate acyltransferase